MSKAENMRALPTSHADDLMEQYADGDDSVFPALYDALAPRLLRFLRRRGFNVAHAEDLLQQTFLHIHRARGTFVRGAHVIPWSYAIARRLLADDLRKAERRWVFVTGAFNQSEDTMKAPDEALAAFQLSRRVDEVLRAIPATHREAFVLIHKEGLSARDAARVLGTSATAVRLRVHRAYVRLRKALNG